jgi:hypothetical protein
MRRLIRAAIRLYPARWRRRYGGELAALLEDLQPGWRDVFDILKGAMAMQINSLRTVPVLCALAGAIGGGLVSMTQPEVYASSATILLGSDDFARDHHTATARRLEISLNGALGESAQARRATEVVLVGTDPNKTTVRVTCADRDPGEAQRMAQALSAAVAKSSGGSPMAAEILTPPNLPTSPVRRDHTVAIASGTVLGLLIGAAGVLLLRSRRRKV